MLYKKKMTFPIRYSTNYVRFPHTHTQKKNEKETKIRTNR